MRLFSYNIPMPARKTKLLCLLALFVCLIGRASAQPARASAPAVPSTLRVAVTLIEPFIMQRDGALRGYDVDVWEQVARRLGYQFEWVIYDTLEEVLRAVKENRVDASLAAISMTPERDMFLDFSYPYFDSGLKIMVRERPVLTFFESIRLVVTPFLLEVALIGLLAGFIMAHIIWLIERRTNPNFPHRYFQGVWEGAWWLVQIIASGAYRDLETKSPLKRGVTVLFWIIGVAILAIFNATLISSLTVHQLTSTITNPDDLPGYRIATVSHTTAADYLEEHELDFTGVSVIQDAYQLLLNEEVDVIVFDAPVLSYYAAHDGNHKVTVPERMFHLEKYGIALPINSPLREQINSAVLQLYQDGVIEMLHQKWFGEP